MSNETKKKTETKTQTQKNLAASKRKTLPRDFSKFKIFKSFREDIKRKTHTVSGWIEVAKNRNDLADALAGLMEGQKLKNLRAGGTDVLRRWAKKLRNQLHNDAQRSRKRSRDGQRPITQQRMQRFRSEENSLISNLKKLVTRFQVLDKKYDNVAPSSAAAEFRKLALDFKAIAVHAVEENSRKTESKFRDHNRMVCTNRKVRRPRDSLVWMLRGHLFERAILLQVSRIIREISPDEIDIVWSNFTINDDLAQPTIAQLEIRGGVGHLTQASTRLLSLFQASDQLQFGPPGSPGLVPKSNPSSTRRHTGHISLYKLVGHLVDRQILYEVFQTILKFNPNCRARILNLKITRGQKTAAIIELEGEPYTLAAVAEKIVSVLEKTDENYRTSVEERTRLFQLSEEDVSQLKQNSENSYTLDLYRRDGASIGDNGSVMSDFSMLELPQEWPNPDAAAAAQSASASARKSNDRSKQSGRASVASLDMYLHPGSLSESSDNDEERFDSETVNGGSTGARTAHISGARSSLRQRSVSRPTNQHPMCVAAHHHATTDTRKTLAQLTLAETSGDHATVTPAVTQTVTSTVQPIERTVTSTVTPARSVIQPPLNETTAEAEVQTTPTPTPTHTPTPTQTQTPTQTPAPLLAPLVPPLVPLSSLHGM